METVSLGRTGTMVSRLCLGAMMFGQRTSESDSAQIINHAIEQGINFIDTSNTYGEWGEGKGRSEEIVGAALAKNGKRDEVILATKFRWVVGDKPNDSRGKPPSYHAAGGKIAAALANRLYRPVPDSRAGSCHAD